MAWILRAAATGGLLLASLGGAQDPYTPKHEPGRCALRGQCGKQGFFGAELPCVDNGPGRGACRRSPRAAGLPLRRQVERRTGLLHRAAGKLRRWTVRGEGRGLSNTPRDRVQALKDNLATASQIVSSCPACKENFYNLFCTFTCSPDQSLFVNITKAAEKNGKLLVTELDQLVSDKYGSGFYDSCKDVKFGPTNSKAMTLIGGGAKNYTDFLKFLGKKRDPRGLALPDELPARVLGARHAA